MHRDSVPPPSSGSARRSSALVVSADSDLARDVGVTLQTVGFDVEAASSGRQALRRLFLGDRVFRLLVVDAQLPGLPVRDWLSVVTSYFAKRTAVIALASGDAATEALGNVRRHCHEALPWPADRAALLAAVGRATRRLARTLDLEAPARPVELERRLGHLIEELLQASGLVRVDALTGLPNRRRLQEDFLARCAACVRSGAAFGLALLDIDRFKRFNELHRNGYAGGDEAIRFVAHALVATCRLGDSVYRYGGDEFVLLLDGTGLADFVAAAERLRTEVLAGAQRAEPDDPLRTLTVSLGAAAVRPQDSGDLEAVLASAAQRLGEAKDAGGNAVRPVLERVTVRAVSA